MTAPEGGQQETVGADPGTSPQGPSTAADQSVGQLLQELSRDTSTLVRQEIRLAQAEMTQKAKLAGLGAGLLGAAAVMGLAVLGAGTAFLIAVIAVVLPVWLAALAVTAFYALLAGGLALAGRREVRRAAPLEPEQTVETLKEDAEWAKTQARSAKT